MHFAVRAFQAVAAAFGMDFVVRAVEVVAADFAEAATGVPCFAAPWASELVEGVTLAFGSAEELELEVKGVPVLESASLCFRSRVADTPPLRVLSKS